MRSSSKKEELTPEGGYKVKIYHPTMEEMKNFSEYVRKIHADGGNRAGLAKIVPPSEYRPRKVGYADDELLNREIQSPIRQEVNGVRGLYHQLNMVERKKMTVRSFKKLAEEKHATPIHNSPEDLERIFWKNVFTQPSIYGADVSGSLFDEDVEEFNLTKLKTILDDMKSDYGITIQGVNTTYLYFGMWKTSFCWHTEDMDLYSINYLHHGAPKSWYTISPEHGKRFERLAATFFPESEKLCKAYLRHKTTLISPSVLKKYSIPFSKCTQEAGEFMITFPYSYHSGYNHGFNIAEATNFAMEYWIEFGKWATRCECSAESVRISMQTFVKRYQSDRYENWVQGKDICEDPRDPRHKGPSPRPTDHDLYLLGYEKPAEDENTRANALQQNQSSNVKVLTKAARKAYPSHLAKTYERYTELFLKPKVEEEHKKSFFSPYPPIPPIPKHGFQVDHESNSNLSYPIEPYKFVPRNCEPYIDASFSQELISQIPDMPNYDQELKELQKKRKKETKEPKQRPKKEKKTTEPALPSKDLLQFLPLTFTHEKRFNRCIAAQPPHCSVCQLLEMHPKDNEEIWGSPHDQAEQTSQLTTTFTAGKQVENFTLPESSRISLPKSVFNSEMFIENDEPSACVDKADYHKRFIHLDLDLESSELVQCSVCMLCVHKTCYGLVDIQIMKGDWICDRCIQKNTRSLVNCELCPCRGGALKELSKGIWAHITCALTVPNMKLKDLISPDKNMESSPIKLPEHQDKSHCVYCTPNAGLSKYIQGRCISCVGYYNARDNTWFSCTKTFHSTCGHRNGVKFIFFNLSTDTSSKSYIRAVCSDCQKKLPHQESDNEGIDGVDDLIVKRTDDDSDPIPQNTQVIARASNGNYYDGIIEIYQNVTYYKIYFPQTSEHETGFTSKNIIDFNPDNQYRLGDPIVVKDGKNGTREGKYESSCEMEQYTIKFNVDSDQPGQIEREIVRRRDIYLNRDQLPKNLMKKYKGAYCLKAASLSESEPDMDICN